MNPKSRSHGGRGEGKDLVLGSEQEEGSDHRQVFRRYLLGYQGRFWGVHCGNTCYSIRGTPKRSLPDDELREPKEPREQLLRIDLRLVAY